MNRSARPIVTILCFLLAGPAHAVTLAECTSTYNACVSGCRSKRNAKGKAICYAACMSAYAACRAAAR